MATQNYERLPIEEFGQQLLRSGDLDPIYIALYHSQFPPGQLRRWLLTYWLVYHAGVSSYLSEREGSEFWELLHEVAVNRNCGVTPDGRWPRGTERRHWRGKSAETCVEKLRERWLNPEDIVDYFAYIGHWDPRPEGDTSPIPYKNVAARVKEHHQFGPWISFKIGDMIERLGLNDICFQEAEVFMFNDPKQAALDLWRFKAKYGYKAAPKNKKTEKEIIKGTVEYLQTVFGLYKAPPGMERLIGLQEIETILCKWKSHMNGHYPLMKDTDEIKDSLGLWMVWSSTAEKFFKSMP